jgi:ATP-dependent DNA helicase RecQ
MTPPYVIFHDRSLREMARVQPQDNGSFRNIVGVGDHKLEKYGPEFIEAIRAYTRSQDSREKA